MTEKKLERVMRTRSLTAEEAAKDDDIRRVVEQEFPPALSGSRLAREP